VTPKLRIFAAGIATETNTFSPLPTAYGDFLVQRGQEVLSGQVRYPALNLDATWGRQARLAGHTFAFSLMAWAQPAGLTVRSAYEQLRDELLSDLRATLPVDVVLLNLHGAMMAEGYEDCERDLIERARTVVGHQAAIGVEFDLHCHLHAEKIQAADIVVTYKEYPHVDMNERAAEVFELAVRTRLDYVRPTTALFDCRMVGLYPTTREPLRTIVDDMIRAEKRPGVLSLSLGHGFQFADNPHVGAKVLAVTDRDIVLAQTVAEEFGRKVYEVRDQIGVSSFSASLEHALLEAIESDRAPVVVADVSDNPGGGAPGDATYALQWLLAHKARGVAIAFIYDPEVVRLCRKAGVGSRLPVRLGGKLGPWSGTPVDIEVSVRAVKTNYLHVFPQQSSEPMLFPAGDVALVECEGVEIVVSSERCQCFSPSIFTDLSVDPMRRQALIVKSVQHFYAGFAPLAAKVIYMAGPGAVTPDPRSFAYTKLKTTDLFPWHPSPLVA
jgi:microcystin degradation protein MlrC